MKYLYSNLSDSVHYNRNAKYVSVGKIKINGAETYHYESARAEQLKLEMQSILNSEDCVLGLTLNQVADNPVFYRNEQQSEELFNRLKLLLHKEKAFISTYGQYTTASSYEKDRIISSWIRICDDQKDDHRFVSSLIEELANIEGNPIDDMIIQYSDAAKRKAHKAVFGLERLVTISKGNVIWGAEQKNIKDYLESMNKNNVNNNRSLGYYTGLCSDNQEGNVKIFTERIGEIDDIMKNHPHPNDPFITDNNITLSMVVDAIINDNLLEKLYIETVDPALSKLNISQKDFLSASKTAFTEISKGANRSEMYEKAVLAIKTYLISTVGYTEQSGKTYSDPGVQRILSFFFQTIDFCYNYFNCLLCFGVRDNVEFRFVPYHRSANAQINQQREGSIIVSNDIFKGKALYKIVDNDNNTVGSYLNVGNAATAMNMKRLNNTEKTYKIIDSNGDPVKMDV